MEKIKEEEALVVVQEAILEHVHPQPELKDIRPEVELFDLHLRDQRKDDQHVDRSHRMDKILNLIMVINHLEDQFLIEIPDEPIFQLWTVADLIMLLKSKVNRE